MRFWATNAFFQAISPHFLLFLRQNWKNDYVERQEIQIKTNPVRWRSSLMRSIDLEHFHGKWWKKRWNCFQNVKKSIFADISPLFHHFSTNFHILLASCGLLKPSWHVFSISFDFSLILNGFLKDFGWFLGGVWMNI